MEIISSGLYVIYNISQEYLTYGILSFFINFFDDLPLHLYKGICYPLSAQECVKHSSQSFERSWDGQKPPESRIAWYLKFDSGGYIKLIQWNCNRQYYNQLKHYATTEKKKNV